MEALIDEQLGKADFLKTVITNYKKDGQARRTRTYYNKKIDAIQSLWDDFADGHRAILIAKRKDKDFKEANCDYFREDFYTKIETLFYTTYEAIQERFEKEYPPESAEISSNKDVTDIGMTVRSNDEFAVKLPKITLDKFSGDYKKWPTFHDLFKTLVHDNQRLSGVQKLQYLKMHLSGEAEYLLGHFQVTEKNYVAAWEALEERYNNKRVLVNAQLKVLFAQNSITTESAQAVKGLLDTTSDCLQALGNLDINIRNWDPIIVFLLVQKLPQESHQLWEQEISKEKQLTTWLKLKEFLEVRFRTLEAINCKRLIPKDNKNRSSLNFNRSTSVHHVSNASSCILCGGAHKLRLCGKFSSYDPVRRFEVVKGKGLCINCLGSGHLSSKCPSYFSCQHCRRQHHTLLHRKVNTNENPHNDDDKTRAPVQNSRIKSDYMNVNNQSFVPSTSSDPKLSVFHTNEKHISQSLLATALVKIISPLGTEIMARALIDPGSQATFITEDIVQALQMKRRSVHATINGVGENPYQTVTASTTFKIRSLTNNSFETEVTALILRKLTSILPSRDIRCGNWKHLNNLQLADPLFYKSQKIDILLGADVYGEIILDGLIRGQAGSPVAQNTTLGWILSGRIYENIGQTLQIQNYHIQSNLNDQLQAFWEIEELKIENSIYNEEETICEELYERTTKHLETGQYEVEIPLRAEDNNMYLGKSREIAVRRLFQMEKRLTKDENLKKEYSDCLNEYITLDHMEPVYSSEDEHTVNKLSIVAYACCYLPHHAVIKATSTKTKVRVVFDASRATQSNVSLNDMMLKGPVVQVELAAIILRWRKHKIAFTADI